VEAKKWSQEAKSLSKAEYLSDLNHETMDCCADCGSVEGEGVSLKACKACMLVKYCNADCQKNHWPNHKKKCKVRAAELRDVALFKDPPPKEEDCPICFLPMPQKLLACISLPPATIMSVPISDYAKANEKLLNVGTEKYYTCCGNTICRGCLYSFAVSGNGEKCPFCNSDQMGRTHAERVEELMKRVAVNDASSIYLLGNFYHYGNGGLQQDRAKGTELWTQAAELGSSQAHYHLGSICHQGGDLKKAKFHYAAAAMAGHEVARNNLGTMEAESGNMERAVKHWMISASAGHYHAMNNMLLAFNKGHGVSKDEIDVTLVTYNNTCAEMRSKARDSFILVETDNNFN
jgi:hypothetical protein